ncbi:hypothetical protein IU468_10140 [Nocardia farcinica]|uniref:hypothetical protein n=1 Tax=Nocardia farcinica TaxID=37329 RepID=UPI0018955214|nr:hypothetical protein [Nocardia farcinica]MBF6256683.1 hypothetical protein [Nocardia farcinica]
MRRIASALLVAALALTSAGAVATAESEPAATGFALVTLTTMPAGWSQRTDLRPHLQVYPDGRAVHRPDATAPDRDPGTEPREVVGTVPREALDKALAEIRALADTDFGVPAGTDQGSQIIDLMPENPAEDVHLILYAPDATDGLSAEQRDARTRFTALYRGLLDAFRGTS